MTIDQLTTGVIDRARPATIQHKMIRGRLTALLITNSTTFHFKDKLTVKLRHAGGTVTLVDRVSMLRLATLTDLKGGMPTTGTPNYVGDSNGDNFENGGFVNINAGVRFYLNALTLPLGHITLLGGEELEISVDYASQPPTTVNGNTVAPPVGKIKISAIADRVRIDTLITYEEIADLESNQTNVRELYLIGKNNISFFTEKNLQGAAYSFPEAKDITVKLKLDGSDTENDIETYSAYTAITGMLTYQPSGLIRIFQDRESVPATVYIKIYGDDKDDAELLVIRETNVPHMVGQSIMAGVEREQKRIETFEANEPEQAEALRQTGKIASSSQMKAALDEFVPASTATK